MLIQSSMHVIDKLLNITEMIVLSIAQLGIFCCVANMNGYMYGDKIIKNFQYWEDIRTIFEVSPIKEKYSRLN